MPEAHDVTALHRLGWDDRVQALLGDDPATVPGRVVRVELDSCQVATADGDTRARSRTPVAVGDWVRVRLDDIGTVEHVAPRWSQVARRDPTGLTQVLAANVDLVLVAVPADRMSMARVEREVAIGWDSGAQPVVLLTKSDLDTGEAAQQLRDRLVGVDVIGVSSVTGDGADDVARPAPAGPHRRAAGAVRCGQVHPHEPAGRPGGGGDRSGARGRPARPARHELRASSRCSRPGAC